MSYRTKGRLGNEIDRYRLILDKDNFREDETHWRRLSKNTISLFQVLIDQDLTDLVAVLGHYPRYTEWVCEHFRYAYSYSENAADVEAASELLRLGEPFFTRQFVRNLVRKLPRIDEMELDELKVFAERIVSDHPRWHPIVTNHYCDAVTRHVNEMQLHPLQRIALTGKLTSIERVTTYDYEAEDRDAVLDIPYMN